MELRRPGKEEFLRGAGKPIEQPVGYPWEDPLLREDVTKSIQVSLPEAYKIKLNYIAERSTSNKRRLLTALVKKWIDKKIQEIV